MFMAVSNVRQDLDRPPISPFYFGVENRRLFGCHHAPQSVPARSCGVVLCYPMGHEYVSSHRAYRLLAMRLSGVGFHVLRFDYFGCGDSNGASEEGGIRQWLDDVSTAVEELRRKAASARIALVGCRLGAALAALAGCERGDIESMVLWDPVVRGQDHLDELRRRHDAMLRRVHVKTRPAGMGEGATEILGFPITQRIATDLDAIDLLEMARSPATHILLIKSDASAEGLQSRLSTLGACVEHRRFQSPGAWAWIEDPEKVLVPAPIVQGVVAWLSEVER